MAFPFYMWHSRKTVAAVLVGYGLIVAGALAIGLLAGLVKSLT